jgi:hypothetical protein
MEDNSLFGFEELKQRVNELIHRSQKSVSTATVSETVWTLCDDSVLPGLGQSVVGTLPDLTLPESLDYYNGITSLMCDFFFICTKWFLMSLFVICQGRL